MTNLTDPIFTNEEKAREHLEAIRWPDGPYCPHCGATERLTRLKGTGHRPGLFQCNGCRQHFTVMVGTIFERSKIPLTKWLLGFHLMAASKKGYSAHQLHRTLGVTYKTAWFMAHRIREAMRELNPTEPIGGEGKTVEMDETYIGGKDKNKHAHKRPRMGRGGISKEIAFSLVERGGKVRSHHIASVSGATLRPILAEQLDASSTVMSDTGGARLAKDYVKHGMVNHGIGEYVRGDVHTNTVEGYFSILKRGITGTYHHVSPEHLKRYLAEFDFRYNERMALGVDDTERTKRALKGAVGKRLTYQQSGQGKQSA